MTSIKIEIVEYREKLYRIERTTKRWFISSKEYLCCKVPYLHSRDEKLYKEFFASIDRFDFSKTPLEWFTDLPHGDVMGEVYDGYTSIEQAQAAYAEWERRNFKSQRKPKSVVEYIHGEWVHK